MENPAHFSIEINIRIGFRDEDHHHFRSGEGALDADGQTAVALHASAPQW
jgi:hypothetical protein